MSRSNSCRRYLARSGAPLVLSFCLLSQSLSWAQTPGSASAVQQADAAFEAGRELFEQGRFKEACDKFELSMQLDPSPGTLLNLGNCYEPQGDLLRALATFEQALAGAEKTRDRRRRQVWTDAARERIASLSQRIPELSVDGAALGSRVLLDGQPLERLGESLRYNPGRHHLEVSAPGKQTYSKVFELREGQRLRIQLPPLEPERTQAPPAAAPPAPHLTTPPAGAAAAPRPRFGPWPWIAGGTGATLLGTSLVTGLLASSKAGRLEDECNGKACDPELESVRNSAASLAVATDVLWISGAVLLGAGVTLFVLDQRGNETTAAVDAGCFDAGCGIQASGRF